MSLNPGWRPPARPGPDGQWFFALITVNDGLHQATTTRTVAVDPGTERREIHAWMIRESAAANGPWVFDACVYAFSVERQALL